ncbi:MAG: hypothetical protein HYU75_00295, partial [Betaproteobacteria bacterium]|nr:hypothetical protein [Betaproteobacteria bacterium]
LAGAVAALAAGLVAGWSGAAWGSVGAGPRLFALAVGSGAGVFGYVAALLLLRVDELRQAPSLLRR